jgi:malate dehydrogenase (oxaloacetate-decarboxylating)
MTIPIGKISLYVAGAGIHPALCLPVCIDVGTNNESLQKDPLYIGLKHKRLEGEEYDFVIEEFVKGVRRNFPHAILQWEDFGKQNALRLLNRYRDRICSFNDDIQGTGAIALATIYSAMRFKNEKLKDQRYVIFGFGQAGYGIANALVRGMMEEGLTEKESKERIYPVDKNGLIVEGMEVDEYQKPFVRDRNSVSGWKLEREDFIGLKDTIHNSKATVLIGTSGVGGSFNEEILREMAKNCEVPVILALSNPTSKSECTPEVAFKATNGRCLIATGSPFPPVKFNGEEKFVSQCNNMYIFPGLGLGAIVSMALKITDEMFVYSAKQVAEMVSQEDLKKGKLLPSIRDIRKVSEMVAFTVAKVARDSGLGVRGSDERLLEMVRNSMWDPQYLPYRWAGEK